MASWLRGFLTRFAGNWTIIGVWRTATLVLVTGAVSAAALAGRVRLDSRSAQPHIGHSGAPMRIVSLAPALTEMACAIGLRDRLVGRSSYCDFPPDVKELPGVGGLLDPSIERIIRLQPDLLLVSKAGRELRGQLDAAGLAYLVLPNESLDDVFKSISILGGVCGAEGAARTLESKMRGQIAAIGKRSKGRPPRRVMVAITASRLPMSPPWVAGPKSYLGTLLELAGHTAVPADLGAEYGEVSIEHVLQTNPDTIIEIRGLAGEPKDVSADARAAWGSLGELDAVRDGRVFVLRGAQHVIPGPRCVDTLEELARLLER